MKSVSLTNRLVGRVECIVLVFALVVHDHMGAKLVGEEYFVDTAGSNSNSGLAGDPVKTISYAVYLAEQNSENNDTIYVKAGL